MLVIALRIPYTDGLEPNGKIKVRYKVLKEKPALRVLKVLKVLKVRRVLKVLKVRRVLGVLKVLKVHKENLEILAILQLMGNTQMKLVL